MISLLVIFNDFLFNFHTDGFSNGLFFRCGQIINCFQIVIFEIGYFLAVAGKFQFFKRKCSNLKWSESYILSEYFVENTVFFSQINHVMPIPFIIHKCTVRHISAQICLLYFFKVDWSGIVRSQKR